MEERRVENERIMEKIEKIEGMIERMLVGVIYGKEAY